MFTLVNRYSVSVSAFLLAYIPVSDAFARNFGDVANNMENSLERVPGLITGFAYMYGLLLGTTGIVKFKDHMENPSKTPMKEGASRVLAGGALFVLPFVMEVMANTVGMNGQVNVPLVPRAVLGLSN